MAKGYPADTVRCSYPDSTNYAEPQSCQFYPDSRLYWAQTNISERACCLRLVASKHYLLSVSYPSCSDSESPASCVIVDDIVYSLENAGQGCNGYGVGYRDGLPRSAE